MEVKHSGTPDFRSKFVQQRRNYLNLCSLNIILPLSVYCLKCLPKRSKVGLASSNETKPVALANNFNSAV